MIFVSPCAVVEDVFAIEGVHRHVVLHPALIKHGVPAVIQNLVLMKVTQTNQCKDLVKNIELVGR